MQHFPCENTGGIGHFLYSVVYVTCMRHQGNKSPTTHITRLNMDSFGGLDLNGAFKIANLAVAALSVCAMQRCILATY